MSSFLNALHGVNRGPAPVWFMRQAGRYLPSYQALRSQHPLLDLFKTPHLAKEVTLLPFQDLELDAAIIFSDILVVYEALGFSVDYPSGGPKVLAPQGLDELLLTLKRLPVEQALFYVFEAIIQVKPHLEVPLLGFSATPFTLLAYLLQKPMTDDIKGVKQALYQEPQKAHALLEILSDLVSTYASLQLKAGVDAFMLFDTASTWLSDKAYLTFSAPYTQKILSGLKCPTILFTKSSLARIPHINQMPLNALSVDWTATYPLVRSKLSSNIGIQGYLDPYLSTLRFEEVEEELQGLLDHTAGAANFIFNLGHGVFPETRLDTLQRIIERVKKAPLKTGAYYAKQGVAEPLVPA